MSENGVSREKRDYLRRIKEARIGDINAQFEVALMYANGLGITKSLEQALVWTQAAADKGHIAAQYLLGRTYQQGLGVGKDPQRALVWYQKAAEQGDAGAQFFLFQDKYLASFSSHSWCFCSHNKFPRWFFSPRCHRI